MKNIRTMAATAVAVIGLGASVQAVPITGSINFQGGTATLNGSVSTATAITAFGGAPVVANALGVAPTGAYAGTGNDAVSFITTGFVFSPGLVPNPVALWSFTDATTHETYSFSLTSVTSSVGVGPSLNLAGGGNLTITGGSSTFDTTAGTWTFSTTGTGPTTFGFVAGNVANGVPDGGMTLSLLGSAFIGLGLLRRKLTA